MNLDLNFDLLYILGEEILGEREYKQLTNSELGTIFQLIDNEEKKFHVEGRILWRIASWKESQVRAEKRRELHRAEMALVDARKYAYDQLREAAQEYLGLDVKMAHIIAYGMMHKKNIVGAKRLGVDLTSVPDGCKPHLVIDEVVGDFIL